jgi:uncharacterized protein YndB with AHSA1/START domain
MEESKVPNSTITYIEDRELIITRVLNASRKLVYKAWTDPDPKEET